MQRHKGLSRVVSLSPIGYTTRKRATSRSGRPHFVPSLRAAAEFGAVGRLHVRPQQLFSPWAGNHL